MNKSMKFVLLWIILFSGLQAQQPAEAFVPDGRETGLSSPLRITVIVDNTCADPALQPDWGFSCLIEGLEKTILFDAGSKPEIFAGNLRKLNIDPQRIDLAVISHPHGDHVGGLEWLLPLRPGLPLYFPCSTTADLVGKLKAAGASPELVCEPRRLCPHAAFSGERVPAGDRDEMIRHGFNEHSLVIDTAKGLLVITGCSHPGIGDMLERVKALWKRPVHMVLGGFHLLQLPEAGVAAALARIRELGVERCGATHCTGDRPIAMFREAFGKDFVELGAGRVIEIK